MRQRNRKELDCMKVEKGGKKKQGTQLYEARVL